MSYRLPFLSFSKILKFLPIIYIEIIINRGVLIFETTKIKIQRNISFPLTVTFNVWNQEFKNPWINVCCKNHKNWCQRIKVPSRYSKILRIAKLIHVLSWDLIKRTCFSDASAFFYIFNILVSMLRIFTNHENCRITSLRQSNTIVF